MSNSTNGKRIGAGMSVRINNGKERRLVHILAVIDGDQIVFKEWYRKRKRWVYFINNYWFFETRKDCIEIVGGAE